jgi:hypothetical protein
VTRALPLPGEDGVSDGEGRTRRDFYSLALLARVLPASLIQEVLEEAGTETKRIRKLPLELVTWLVVGLGLYRGLGIKNVLQRLADGLNSVRWGPAELPHSTSISQARVRLGWEAVRLLFRKLAAVLRETWAERWRWKGLVPYVLDGTSFLVPDSRDNDAWFGRPGTSRGGPSAFPQLRAVMLMSAWSHLVVDAVFAPYRGWGELRMAQFLLRSLKPDSLVLVDRLYHSFTWLAGVREREAHFVVRAKKGRCALRWSKRRALGPRDWLGYVPVPPYLKRKHPELPDEIEVRCITRGRGKKKFTLITSLLDPERFRADDIVELYQDRWEAELGYRELKIHMGRKGDVFRSRKPELVIQEAYGLLIAYNCVRALMAEAGDLVGAEPRRISFVDSLERVRWTLGELADGHVRDPQDRHQSLVARIALRRLPPRRTGRSCRRAVKRKMSNYPRKRPGEKTDTSRKPKRSSRRAQAVAR